MRINEDKNYDIVFLNTENLIEQVKKENCACDIVFVAIDQEGNKTTIK